MHADAMTPVAADTGHLMVQFVLQLGLIIIAARMGGSLFNRALRLPRVLGELAAGMAIGPYALGRLSVPGFGTIFPLPESVIPVSPQLYAIATLASIILLFVAGLETDLATFLRYSVAGTLVGLGGVIFSFLLGDLAALWFGLADSFMDPEALFLGTISTATSVGITARILTEKKKNDTPEGVTIMAAAVFDDVLGIVLLAVVVGISRIGSAGEVDWAAIGAVAAKAFGFWIVCTAVALMSARRISRLLKLSRTPATIASMSLGMALLLAGFSEMAGLAMIIGAYIMGLSLSRTDLAPFLEEQLQGIHDILVPVFFCCMGMLVDFSAMYAVLTFGLVYTLLAAIAKIFGCALPAAISGFNLRGCARIGLGMLPRGEVALIVASIGLSSGAIPSHIFGVAILMTVLTTVVAPPALLKAFEGGWGLRRQPGEKEGAHAAEPISLEFPSADITEFLVNRLVEAFRQEEFFVQKLHVDVPTFQLRKEEMIVTVVQNGRELLIMTPREHEPVARLLILEALISLQDLLDSCRQLKGLQDMESSLARGIFE